MKNKKQFVRTALTKTGAATGSVTNENRDSDNDEPPFLGLTRLVSHGSLLKKEQEIEGTQLREAEEMKKHAVVVAEFSA